MNNIQEYKRLLVLEKAIDDFEGIPIDYSVQKRYMIPLISWVRDRIKELEEE